MSRVHWECTVARDDAGRITTHTVTASVQRGGRLLTSTQVVNASEWKFAADPKLTLSLIVSRLAGQLLAW